MSVSLITQPSNLMAAYRPIVFIAAATGLPPVVYCDVYFAGVYYKTFSKTQPLANGNYQFDISDAAQEFLTSLISPNGGSLVVSNQESIVSCYCMFRGSITDANGFIVPDVVVPVQATSSQPAVSGSGFQSATFYIVNATLQHQNNQNLTTHLNSFKAGIWDSTLFPLTHRPANQSMYYANSDYFPVANVGTKAITSLRLNYRLKGTLNYIQLSNIPCVAVTASAYSLPTAMVGVAYNQTLQLSGTAPFTLSNIITPAWLSVSVTGSFVSFIGTPASGDVGSTVPVSLTVANACGSIAESTTMIIAPSCVASGIVGSPILPDGTVGTPYSYSFNLSGTAPFTLSISQSPSWMSITITGNTVAFSGTPDVAAAGISVQLGFANCDPNVVSQFFENMNVGALNNTAITGNTFFGANNGNSSGVITATPGTTVSVHINASGPPSGSYTLNITVTNSGPITGNTTVSNGTAIFTFVMPSSGSVSWSGSFQETNSSGSGSISVS